MTNSFRRFVRTETGAELLEFAVVLPILMLLTAGIFDFAVLFQRYEVVTNAAREGARMGVLPGYSTADIQSRVQSYLINAGLTDTAPTPTVAYATAPFGAGGLSMTTVSVTVQYPHKYIFLGPVAAMLGGTPEADTMLAARATMRQEIAAAP
jgi:Flp pilus assembly protein TadG